MRNTIIECGEALYGPRFQRELARDLGVNERTVRRWLAGDTSPPEGVRTDLQKLLRKRQAVIAALLSEKG